MIADYWLGDASPDVGCSQRRPNMDEKWCNADAIIACMVGLDKAHGGEVPQESVLAFAELLRQDLDRGAHLAEFALMRLCDAVEVLHKDQKLTSVVELYRAAETDLKNLVCVGVLGKSYGEWPAAKALCNGLHKASLAYGVTRARL